MITIPRFREKLEILLSNRQRPVLHGEVAAWVGCSLEATARELEPILEEGLLCRMTPQELRSRGWDARYVAYRKLGE